MFILAIIGFIAIFWCLLNGLVRIIPWLVVLFVITSVITYFDDHLLKASILVVTLVCAYFAGKEWDKSSKKQNNAKHLEN